MSELDCQRMRYELLKGMVSKIEPDRYANTGFSIKDTSPEMNALLFEKMMQKSQEERFIMGLEMLSAAKQMMWTSIPENLPEAERRKLFFERFYSEAWPAKS